MRSEKKSADVAGATASIFAVGDRKKILQLSIESQSDPTIHSISLKIVLKVTVGKSKEVY